MSLTLTRRLIIALALMAGISPAFAQAPPPVPALPDTERRTSYSISATTCACNVGFALYGDATDFQNWIEVFINGVRVNFNDVNSGWSISSPTGSVATIPRPITDAVLTFNSAQTGTIQIVGARRPRRVSQFAENRGVAARDINQALTDIIAQNRETWDKINDVTGRAVLGLPGETMSLLPAATTRANQGACFNSSGSLINCVAVPTSTFIAGTGISLSGVSPTTISVPLTGDCTLGAPAAITCTKTNGVAYAPSATTDTTNASNIVSGTLSSSLFAAVKSINVQKFITTGTFTYTPTANMTFVDVSCVGGGGGGGGNSTTVAGQGAVGGGGGSGGYARGVFSAVTIGASKAVVIGGPGAGGIGITGGAGGQSSFGSTFLVANGGVGGTGGTSNTATIIGPGAGGTASTSSTVGAGLAITGQAGYDGWSSNAANLNHGGSGGSGFYGGGGTTAMTNSSTAQPGNAATSSGGGGSGSSVGVSGTQGTGGTGAAGSCIMIEYING